MKNYRKLTFVFVLFLFGLFAWGKDFIPAAPDYNDSTMWYRLDEDPDGTGADVFYVVSTWEIDWQTSDGKICHYADVYNPEHRERMSIEIRRAGEYMGPGNRFYSPYYRHITIDAWVSQNEKLIKSRARLAMKDVCDAFDCFLKTRDQSRPLIIAGFSQGGMAVVELLKHMSNETYSKVAAAYVLGYKVTEKDLKSCKHIKPAQGEDDVGVTICYNTTKGVQYVIPVISASAIGINPVNWRTDDTPATLNGNITVVLSPEYHVLVLSGYDGAEYKPYRNFINVGDIHSCEPWLYKDCLKKNIAVRTAKWRENK